MMPVGTDRAPRYRWNKSRFPRCYFTEISAFATFKTDKGKPERGTASHITFLFSFSLKVLFV